MQDCKTENVQGRYPLVFVHITDTFRRTAYLVSVCSQFAAWVLEFCAAHALPRIPERVYFSLGDRESRTRDPLLRRTEDDTRALCEALRKQGVESVFERNPGGHFQDAEKRLARGLAWITGKCDGDE